MSEPQTITTDHVRALLQADGDQSMLGLVGGEVQVLEAARLDDDDVRGALEVTTRGDLVERLGDDPDDGAVEEEAAALTAAVQLLGG